jgi:putative DNA primase/helicase
VVRNDAHMDSRSNGAARLHGAGAGGPGRREGVCMVNEPQRAAAALFHLDPSCPREEWVKAGMAAKAAGLSFDEFHEWSASAGNYAGERDCRAVWQSFRESGPVTANSLFAMAYAQGWRDQQKGLQAANGGRVSFPIAAPRKAPVTPITHAESAKAGEVWNRCEPATALHEYITRKQGNAEGLRIYPGDAPPLTIRGQNVAGFLVVPCRDLSGKLQTLQFVPGKGDKLNLPSASFGNGCFVVGDLTESRRVFIAEGIGQAWAAWQATGQAAVVTFGAGRMATVADVLRAEYPAARLVVLLDRGKEGQAEAIARTINGEWCELPADKPGNYDANDLIQEAGAEALANLLDRAKAPAKPEPRFKLLSGADLSNAPPMRWMVRGVLPLEGLAALYGPSGSGKSFLMLDVAASVAGGAYEWFGRRVAQCPVTYCALEGEAGMGKRMYAWSQHHKKPVPNTLRFITQPFDLLNAGDVVELAKAVQSAGGAGGLVILDTLNRAAPGADENSSVDMGRIIAAAKQLQSLTGGLVLLVHHTGKDATKGLRGHSSLYAALDGAIEVNRTDSRREWSVAKSKDDETGTIHAFKLEVVTLGHDDEGEEIPSCVAEADEARETVKRIKLPQGGNQRLIFDALRPLFLKGRTGMLGAPSARPCIELEAAVSAGAASLTCPTDKRTSRSRDAITGLVARGVMGCNEGWVWLV